jgi:hypothetical protein
LGHEAFLILVYLVAHNVGPIIDNPIHSILAGISLPDFVVPFASAKIGVFQVLAALCAPSFVSKSCVHVVQLTSASNAIVTHELKANKKIEKKDQ